MQILKYLSLLIKNLLGLCQFLCHYSFLVPCNSVYLIMTNYMHRNMNIYTTLYFWPQFWVKRRNLYWYFRIQLLICTILGFRKGVTMVTWPKWCHLLHPCFRVPLMEIEDVCVYVMDGKYDMCNFCDQIREYNLEPFISSIILSRCYVLR